MYGRQSLKILRKHDIKTYPSFCQHIISLFIFLFIVGLTVAKNPRMTIIETRVFQNFPDASPSHTRPFQPIKLNSLLCLELLFHKPLKNDILAQRRTSNSNSSEIFSLVTICLASFLPFESSSLTHKSRDNSSVQPRLKHEIKIERC